MKQIRLHMVVICVLSALLLTVGLSALRNLSIDARFSLFPRQATGEVVVIAIDAPSLDEIGVWPWPRKLHAQLIKKLRMAGVSDIAFDVDFHSASNAKDDELLAKALETSGGTIILPTFKQYARDKFGTKSLHVNEPLPSFKKHIWPATVNVVAESGGEVRNLSFGEQIKGNFVPSLSALLAGVYETKNVDFVVDFSIPPQAIPVISYIDVLNGEIPPERLKGKKIIVGGTAIELGDRFQVPVHGIIPGPILQALGTETIVQKRTLFHAEPVVSFMGIAVLIIITQILWTSVKVWSRLAILISLALAIETLAALIQSKSLIILDTSLWLTVIFIYIFVFVCPFNFFQRVFHGVYFGYKAPLTYRAQLNSVFFLLLACAAKYHEK